ncbi:MAG: hypothetical protein LBI28_13085 [Treponema sp.]|jgi:Na+-driven multidrug efflux pump|nr:hypothetical protein [Treponema sp.]
MINVSAEEKVNVKKIFAITLPLIIQQFFCKGILGIFTNDASYISYAASFLLIVSITMFPKAINNVIGLGIRGIINIMRFWKGREFFSLKPFENVIVKTGI